MFRHTEADGPHSSGAADDAIAAGLPLTGVLDGLLTTAPHFHTRVRGYDRYEVDEYVAWAEGELAAARREAEHLLARYGACAAELEISRRLLAQAPKGRDLSPVSDRVRDILQLAADEASDMVASAADEADELLAEARVEADARLRKAHQVKELAATTADEMRELARQDRVEAAALRERARAEAEELAAQSAEARGRLAALRAEVEDLLRERDDAGASLRRLTDQIEAALALATAGPSERFLLVGNRVESPPVPSVAS